MSVHGDERAGRDVELERPRSGALRPCDDLAKALVAAWVARVEEHGAGLVRVETEILAHAEQCAKDLRFIADECRAIGDEPPKIDNDAPLFVSGITRLCQRAVRARNVRDGISRDVEQSAALLVVGTHE